MYFRTFVQHQRPTPLRNEGRRFGKRSPSFLKTKGIVFAKEGHRFLQVQALARIASPTPYYIYAREGDVSARQEWETARASKGCRRFCGGNSPRRGKRFAIRRRGWHKKKRDSHECLFFVLNKY